VGSGPFWGGQPEREPAVLRGRPPLQPIGDDAANDGYGLVPIELDWTKTGLDANGRPDDSNVAYSHNGVTITHFPVVHDRKGSIDYKLE